MQSTAALKTAASTGYARVMAKAPLRPELLRLLPTALVAFFFAILTCSCGHHGILNLPLVVCTGLWIRWAHVRPRARLVYGALVLFGCLATTKLVRDVLWQGHDPWLTERPQHLIVPLDVSILLSLLLISYGVLFWLHLRAQQLRARHANLD